MGFGEAAGNNTHICKKGTIWREPNDRKQGCVKAFILEHVTFDYLNKLPDASTLFGLAESLYPLTWLAVQKQAKDLAALASVNERRVALQAEIDALIEREKGLASLFGSGKISLEAFGTAGNELKINIESKKLELADAGMPIDAASVKIIRGVDLSKKILHGKLADAELSDLLHMAIKSVSSYQWHIDIELYDGTKFKLERLKHLRARTCPAWTAEIEHSKANGLTTRLVVRYYYRSWYKHQEWSTDEEGNRKSITDGMETVILDHPDIKLIAVGDNKR